MVRQGRRQGPPEVCREVNIMHEPFDITTIIFALLAIFVVWKLRSVLGTRTGEEKPPRDWFFRSGRTPVRAPSGEAESNIIHLPGADARAVPPKVDATATDKWKDVAEPGSELWRGLEAIAAVDPSFATTSFLSGAKAAYEMIVTAFATGDRRSLQNLLAPEVYDNFTAAITARESRGEKIETTFVSIDAAKLEEAHLRDRLAQITVRFAAKLITATHDRDGTLIDGSPDKVVDMNDLWTFVRDTGSRDPNWKLVATETAH